MANNNRTKLIARPDKQALTEKHFVDRLMALRSPEELKKQQRFFKFSDEQPLKNDEFIGVRMGQVFALAKEFMDTAPDEIEKILENRIHEARVGAVSMMDFQARSKKTLEERKKELFDLYIRRHDRINSWDMVDRSAPYVVGSYLLDKPRDILYTLAHSKSTWERRTAIVSTLYFIGKGEVEDTFKIAEILLNDNEDLIHKATGWALRYAGDKERAQLERFLDTYAAAMPRTALRYALEHFDKEQRNAYLKRK